MPNSSFTNLGTKVALEKDKNSAVSIDEGAVKSHDKMVEEGFGFAANKSNDPKSV